jgi:pyrimidine-nucleoside phosphorylase/thymidine phosphorylase
VRAVDLIQKKRDGTELSRDELFFFVKGFTQGAIPDYQASAMAMAVFFKGMAPGEILAFTEAMRDSGEVLDLSDLPGPKVDKHSTGGVGDKTSLVLAPLVAACGAYVPMISGRGLGHTGGTLDKLESIQGFNVHLSLKQFRAVLEKARVALIGQTPEIAPADRRLYALRDVTATVESLPLIAASIMSKKMAEGIDALVLDVKTGDGAFLQSMESSKALASTMVEIGKGLGKKVIALITDMDQPLGRCAGNSLEVAEAIETLKGRGPTDLESLSIELAARMIASVDLAPSLEAARVKVRDAMASGRGLERFRSVIELQGGDPRVCDNTALLPQASSAVDVKAESDGRVIRLAARALGRAAMLLGAGRERVDSLIDPAVGIVFHKKVGDLVVEGEPILTLRLNHPGRLKEAMELVKSAVKTGRGPISQAPPLIRAVLD